MTSAETWRRAVFFVTFVNYAIAHLARKCYTTVKTELVAAGVDKTILSQMDTGFMLAYAAGTFISGRFADRFRQNVLISVGLFGSAVCLGAIQLLDASRMIKRDHGLGFFLFVLAQLTHGAFQSLGGPVNTSVMGAWWPKKGRGLVFGLWTCHQYVGDIGAALVSAYILHRGWPWQWALLVPAVASGVWGVINLAFLPNSPSQLGIEAEGEANAPLVSSVPARGRASEHEHGGVGFMDVLRIPGVLSYALLFGSLKLANYALFFWLPFFLSLHFPPDRANTISSLYSVGLMPGGVIVGLLSDALGGRRACVITSSMCLLVPLLWVFAAFADSMAPALLLPLLVLMGILIGGPNNIISSAVAADLAEHPSVGGNARVLGTITGVISGSGSVTAALGLAVIGPLQEAGGWPAIWYLLIACVCGGIALMAPKVHRELTAGSSVSKSPTCGDPAMHTSASA